MGSLEQVPCQKYCSKPGKQNGVIPDFFLDFIFKFKFKIKIGAMDGSSFRGVVDTPSEGEARVGRRV